MGPPEILVTALGLALLVLLGWFFFGPKRARMAEVTGGRQEIEITVKGGYSPNLIRVREGVPLRLTFNRQESGDCTSRVVFPDFGVSKSLPAFGKATLEFVPDRPGEFGFACGAEPVKHNETRARQFFCASLPIVGSLIHASVGIFASSGRRWRNLAGLAA